MQIYTSRCGNTSGQKCHAKGRGGDEEITISDIMYRDKMKCRIIPVRIGATGIVTKSFKKFVSHTRITFNRFTIKDSCTRNITYNTSSTAG